jgi:hypothetical protein
MEALTSLAVALGPSFERYAICPPPLPVKEFNSLALLRH